VIAQRLDDAGERLRQELEHRLDRATDDGGRVEGKDDRRDNQTRYTADQRIERALERQPIDRGLDRCDKHCGDRGLRDREGSTALRRRSFADSPSVSTAAMGAKKGSEWPSTSVATSQAAAAAIAV
jgi:hypothetical protein